VIHSRVFGSVRSQIEDGAGRADLPFWDARFPRHVLRYMKTWRGFHLSSFGRIFHRRCNTPDRWDLRTTEKSSAVGSRCGVRESHLALNGLKVSKDHI